MTSRKANLRVFYYKTGKFIYCQKNRVICFLVSVPSFTQQDGFITIYYYIKWMTQNLFGFKYFADLLKKCTYYS